MPTFLRKELMAEWLKTALRSLQDIYLRFVGYSKDTTYGLQHNSQVCYLQKVLNDTFDNEHRRIKVADVTYRDYVRFYSENIIAVSSQLCIKFGEVAFYRNAGTEVPYDFMVQVPQEVFNANSTDYISAIVRQYKLAGKRFEILIKN
jgi:hypothetical protein